MNEFDLGYFVFMSEQEKAQNQQPTEDEEEDNAPS